MGKRHEVSFNVGRSEADIIRKIAARAVAEAQRNGVQYSMMTATMDITATHANGNPLKLQELLEADAVTFAHDVFGIRHHIDRDTGQLKNCFVPRLSVPQR
jgi:uncharacterized protein DUF6874